MDHLASGYYLPTWLGLSLTAVVYGIVKVVYRLYFGPLAGFPGPKLAAATDLYNAYYDLILHGSFIKQLPALHRKYGSVVRISPNELHVKDLECYQKIFKVGTPFDKRWEFYSSPPFQGSLLVIPGTTAAGKRREAYNHHFSKSAIRRAEDLMQGKVSRFIDILRSMAKGNRQVDLSRGYRCLTADTITEYVYQEDLGGLGSKEFNHPVPQAVEGLLECSKWASHFSGTVAVIAKIANHVPDKALAFLVPQLSAVRSFEASCAKSIQKLKQRSPSDSTPPTMFDVILNPEANKSKEVMSDSDLKAEALLMLFAGMDTTSNALVTGTWGLLQNELARSKLMEELYQAVPHRDSKFDAEMIEKLPYLKGVVKESLRLSYGAPGRIPRIVPASGLTLLGKEVPPGTIISHSNYLYHSDEAIFPDAQKFLPDRWLQDNTKELEQHMHAFSRGSRACLGIHLATAELFLVFARLFRTFEIEAFETTSADMEWDDFAVPLFKGHLNVMMHEIPT
ncbi:hypothetical protein MMC29_000624 [Sticta canariensis]|nr:hypothetical protein [Sticta canariensis]